MKKLKKKQLTKEERDRRIVALASKPLQTVKRISKKYGLSESTIRKIHKDHGVTNEVRKTKKQLRVELWNLVREYVYLRDNSMCQKCGKYQEKGLNCSHVIPKSHGNVLRFTPINLKLLCYDCHKGWWHANPTESGKWFREKWPDRSRYIEEHKNDIVKWKEADYIQMIEDITAQIDEAKKNKTSNVEVHARGI